MRALAELSATFFDIIQELELNNEGAKTPREPDWGGAAAPPYLAESRSMIRLRQGYGGQQAIIFDNLKWAEGPAAIRKRRRRCALPAQSKKVTFFA